MLVYRRRWIVGLRYLLLSVGLLTIVPVVGAEPPPAAKSARIPPDERLLVARVFDHQVFADQLEIEGEEEHLRKQLSPQDFERWRSTHRAQRLVRQIVGRAKRHYAKEHNIEPPADQIDNLTQQMMRTMDSTNITQEGKDQQQALTHLFAKGMVADRVIAERLFQKHGGRVAFGSLGSVVAIDGEYALLKQLEQEGDLVFHDVQLADQFWQQLGESRGDYVREGEEARERLAELEQQASSPNRVEPDSSQQ